MVSIMVLTDVRAPACFWAPTKPGPQTADLEWMSKKYKKNDYSTIRGLSFCVCVHNRV